ncbi:MAG TPA: DUF4253 domain-containing protein [Phycisphaerae bacterium]|nr:DUF4253 domain-containing protein [Phycisphaerae bacterium]HRW55167.1 DUF4253 domain-containing protein [Phycisphaerae bacterium]
MDRKWNPDIPTRRVDVEATIRDAGIDPNEIVESFSLDSVFEDNSDPDWKSVISDSNESNHLFYILVDKDKAIDLRARIKPFAAYHGLFPIIHGDIMNGAVGCPWFADNPASVLSESSKLVATDRAVEWPDEARIMATAYPEFAMGWPDRCMVIDAYEIDPAFLPAEWPTNIPMRKTPYLIDTVRPASATDTAIVFLPGANGPEALSRIVYGGNQAPTAVMIAYLRQWDERYGADIINLNWDSIELRVSHPPTTREDACRFARECILLCPALHGEMQDFHGFRIESLYDLAVHLMGSEYLIFWWD